MSMIDKELEKIKHSDIKRFERVLQVIDKYEKSLQEDFDNNLELILGDIFIPILEEVNKNEKLIALSTKVVTHNGKTYKIPTNFLTIFHKSYINNPELKQEYENRLKMWFADKTEQLRRAIKDVNNYDDIEKIMPSSFALASLALTSFHKNPNMILRDVQKMAGIAISEGSITELGTGEGKTLSGVLPTFLQALRGKGVHVITANPYLAKRDFEETLPIYEGLGLTSGYLPDSEEQLAEIEGLDKTKLTAYDRIKLQRKLKVYKQEAYKSDITYGSKQTFAFDYLRDNTVSKQEDMIQRIDRPGFALIDEVDDALIDDAEVPYRIAVTTPMYKENMSLRDLCIMQNISYDEIYPQVSTMDINIDNLSFEEARYISRTFGKRELLVDPRRYQEAAERFFKTQKVLVTEDNKYGFKTGKELFEALSNEEKYDVEEVIKTYGIILSRELRDYKISDKCIEDFLRYCYFSFQINSQVLLNQKRIENDPNYKKDEDYIIMTNGKMKVTMKGANRILSDKNYPDFINDYNMYLSAVSSESATLLHYFQQAVIANLLMEKGKDYIVEDGVVKTLKNGRIQSGSSYSNGLHQALEIKENIPFEKRTKESTASSTITQKDYYSRYDMFSGMTGTSSKEVFGEIFGKSTVEIPRHSFYSFYGRRKKSDAKEPIGVENKDTKFALTLEDKINLIVNSITESLNSNPKQPILLVVSDVNEIKLLQRVLQEKGILFNTLTATTPKEDEALIIARAGLPGMVTISTEMAGRGTDIKIGGDRETIIDIATERHIRQLEKKVKHPLQFSSVEKEFLRNKVEQALISSKTVNLWTKEDEKNRRDMMEKTGLKVISSGFFKMTRIDRQLEGRTGRNGLSGVCERFATPDDLKRLGISSFNMKDSIVDFFKKFKRNIDGSLDLDKKSYELALSKVLAMQKNIESQIKERIKNTQKLDSYATKAVEEYRDQRRRIICDSVDKQPLIESIIEEATDGIISSYIEDRELTKEDLTKRISSSDLNVNINGISLEVKQYLGITFDPNIVSKSNINLLELRDAIIRTAKARFTELKDVNTKNALLTRNDYMISNIPEVLEHSFTVRNLTSMSMGMEGQADYEANMEFANSKRRLQIEASKEGAKKLLGIPLSIEEFKSLEAIKKNLFEIKVDKSKEKEKEFEVTKTKYNENNVGVIARLKAIKAKIDERNQRQLQKIEHDIDKAEKKGNPIDIKELYSRLDVRPMKFIEVMVDGKNVSKLVLVRERKQLTENDKRASLH